MSAILTFSIYLGSASASEMCDICIFVHLRLGQMLWCQMFFCYVFKRLYYAI